MEDVGNTVVESRGSHLEHMESDALLHRLDRLFRPASVALVGVSADPRKLSGRPLRFLRSHGYRGRVYLVNPHRSQIDGLPSHPGLSVLPEVPDTVLITLPADEVPTTVEEAGKLGIPNAVILSAGFEETSGSAGRVRKLAKAATRYGVSVVGPNSEGLWAVPSRTILTFGSAASRRRIRSGPVSVISQSGSIGGACVRRLQDLGIGCRFYVSTGNESVLTTVDYLEYIVVEGGSSVVLLFIEGLRDGWRMQAVAAAARLAGVHLIALKAGRSEAGRRATQSHTGQFSSAGDLYADLFRQVGVVEVETVDELIAAALAITTRRSLGGHGGGGVGVISVSGGSRSLIVDECERRRVPLASFRMLTRSRLREILPREAAPDNPIDPTGRVVDSPELLVGIVDAVVGDPGTDSVLVQFPNWGWSQVLPHLTGLERAAAMSHKPVVIATLTPDVRTSQVAALRRVGLILARSTREAVLMLALLSSRSARRPALANGRRASTAGGWSDRLVDRLRAAGVPVIPTAVCRDLAELPAALALIGLPAVIKAGTLAHKSDRGLVRLGLNSKVEVEIAAEDLWRRTGIGTPLLLQTYAQGGVEVLLNLRRDPDWGPVLTLGTGGVETELWRDAVSFGLPVTAPEVGRGLRQLKLQKLLDGYRGNPATDQSALLLAAVALSEQYLRSKDDVEIEINPLLVLPKGRGVVAVDLSEWSGPERGTTGHRQRQLKSVSSSGPC